MGCHFLLQGIFPTQGSNLSLLYLLHRRQIFLPAEPSGKPSTQLLKPKVKESFFLISLFFFNCIVVSQCCVGLCCTTKGISYMCMYIPSVLGFSPTPPALSSHPSRSSVSIELSSLCYTAGSYPLSVLHMVACICNPNLPIHSTRPSPLRPHIHSLCLHLYSCPAQVGSSLPFFSISYVC